MINGKKTILLCDDDEGILEVVTMILEEKGYRVKPVVNCDNIISEVIECKPDMVLLDLWMPGIGGAEITKILKKNTTTKNIPVIVVSASKDTEVVARQSGADDFICKPFDIDELENKVASYFN